MMIDKRSGADKEKKRGFDDTEIFSLDVTIAKFVLPRLKYFKRVSSTCPYFLTEEEWAEKLDKMITSFSLMCDDNYSGDANKDAKIEEGLKLFGKCFRSLWG